MKLCDKIRYLREVEGQLRGLGRAMTQGELVRAMREEMGDVDGASGANGSLSQSYLSQIESGARPHLTNTTRQILAGFFKVHPGYLVDDPEGYSPELQSEVRNTEDKLDLWLISGAERFRRDPELKQALLTLAQHEHSRECLLLLEAIMETPGLMPRLGVKPMMIIGLLPGIVAMAWLSRVSAGTGYWTDVFGPMMLIGIGFGLLFVPLTTASLAGVPPKDSGAASAMINMLQLVGGSLGLAVLVAVFGTSTRNAASHPVPGLTAAAQAQHVLAHGIGSAFLLAAILDVAALLVILLLIRTRQQQPAAATAMAAPRQRPAED